MAALFLAGLPSSCFTERRRRRPQPWPWPQSVDVDGHVGRWNACDSVGLDLLESLPNALVPTVPAETPALRPRPLGTEQCELAGGRQLGPSPSPRLSLELIPPPGSQRFWAPSRSAFVDQTSSWNSQASGQPSGPPEMSAGASQPPSSLSLKATLSLACSSGNGPKWPSSSRPTTADPVSSFLNHDEGV